VFFVYKKKEGVFAHLLWLLRVCSSTRLRPSFPGGPQGTPKILLGHALFLVVKIPISKVHGETFPTGLSSKLRPFRDSLVGQSFSPH